MNALTWRRNANGVWSTSAPINGEPGAFEAFAYRVAGDRPGATRWRVECFTWDRVTDTAHASLLAPARAHADAVYNAVEGVNR